MLLSSPLLSYFEVDVWSDVLKSTETPYFIFFFFAEKNRVKFSRIILGHVSAILMTFSCLVNALKLHYGKTFPHALTLAP